MCIVKMGNKWKKNKQQQSVAPWLGLYKSLQWKDEG